MSDEDSPGDEPEFDRLCNMCAGLFTDDVFWTEAQYRPHRDIPPEDILQLQKELVDSPTTISRQIGVNIRGVETLTLWMAAWNTRIRRKGWDTCRNGWLGIARFRIRALRDDYTQEVRAANRHNFSKSTIDQVSLWLEQCDSSHAACRKVQTITPTRKILPTRLLDLSLALDNGNISLCESRSLRVGVKYATLSHCWGGQCKKRLTVKALAEFQKGISLGDLPKTFRDAVLVTKALGLHYLWIDALCIIQDSVNGADWIQEASMMGDVYANSHITLAATTSPNSEGGLLHRRSPLSVWPCKVTATWKCFQAGELVISTPSWADETDLEPLASRSWAFQEWLLSKRLLHFGKDQVRWQCFCLAASEVYHDGDGGDDGGLNAYGIPTKGIIVRLVQDPQRTADRWLEIREGYSQKALTKATDRLPALTGIARMVHRTLNSTEGDYLAGIWKPHLLQELLWQRGHHTATSTGTDTLYIAPSWSWACLKAPFLRYQAGFNSKEVDWLVHVVKVEVDTIGDAFGPVNSGSLTVRCSLSYIDATLQHGEQSTPEQDEQRWTIGGINALAVGYNCNLSFDDPEPSLQRPQTRIFLFMPIRAGFGHNPHQNTVAGLLLQDAGHCRGQYRRIGLLNIFGGRHQPALLSSLGKGAAPSETCYLETESRADRMIEIV
ncbi:hypothetical protein PV04_02605 [Phialophora macrospora]|uniref:Heterokaryon incompatibility domain-containing protein n=1 Tax=Phialophora macrospora TaxID=1851006 RepID=A0A0D2E7M4_9EURO|nr:hypothetical protein PV04_02605 [Phialophora macrospora]